MTAEGTGGELHYLAGHHRRLLSGGGRAPFSLLFLSCLQCEKGSVRKGRMDQFSAMVAAFCYDKGCAWYATGTPLLDVAGGSRSRIKPSFNDSWILPPPSWSWLLAGNRLKTVFITCPHLRGHLECIWFTSETTEAKLVCLKPGHWISLVVSKAAQIPGSAYQSLYWKTSLKDSSPIVPPSPPLQVPICLIHGLFPEGFPLLPPILTCPQSENETRGPGGSA